jgi:hypothetical protein
MTKDRTAVKENIDLKYILPSKEYMSNNLKNSKFLHVTNLKEINQQISAKIKECMVKFNQNSEYPKIEKENINTKKGERSSNGFNISK